MIQGIPIYHLAALREWRGLTQQALGDAIGMCGSHVSMLETGRTQPTPRTVQRLAAGLGVSEAVLRTPDRLTALVVAACVYARLPEGRWALTPTQLWAQQERWIRLTAQERATRSTA